MDLDEQQVDITLESVFGTASCVVPNPRLRESERYLADPAAGGAKRRKKDSRKELLLKVVAASSAI